MAIGKASWCLASGSMTHAQFSSRAGGGWFWSQLRRQRTHSAPEEGTWMWLQSHYRLGGSKIHRYHSRLKLQKQQFHLFMPNYVRKALKQFQHGQMSQQQNPPSKRTNTTWSQDTICNRIVFGTTARCKRKEVHPSGMGKIPIFWTCGWQYTPLPSQCHRITILETNRGYDETNATTPWLHSYTRRGRTNLQCKQNKTSSAQWW